MNKQVRTSGRAAKNIFAEVDRLLGEDDLEMLSEERETKAPQIVALRERHHAIARLIAEGKKPGEAALLCRYSQSRVSILLDDPAFRELVEHYRGLVNAEFVDFQKKLAELGVDAAMILQERLEETPNEISDALLLQLVQVSADRTGHGPSAKSEVNIKIGLADRLAQARERSLTVMKDVTPLNDSI